MSIECLALSVGIFSVCFVETIICLGLSEFLLVVTGWCFGVVLSLLRFLLGKILGRFYDSFVGSFGFCLSSLRFGFKLLQLIRSTVVSLVGLSLIKFLLEETG